MDGEKIKALVGRMGATVEARLPNYDRRFMLPWIGGKYDASSFKLLILGESTFHDPKSPFQNIDPRHACIGTCELGRWHAAGLLNAPKWRRTGNFFPSVVTYITGKGRLDFPPNEFAEVWEEWVFWDLVQEPLQSSMHRPTKAQFQYGWYAFGALIRLLEPAPDLVVVVGYSMRSEFIRLPKIQWRQLGQDGDYFEYLPATARLIFLPHPAWLPRVKRKAVDEHKRLLEITNRLRRQLPT